MALQNKWYLRTVGENSGKPCWIDYKTTTSVLITPDNKDFFYICRGHLKDRTFCTPSAPAQDGDAAAKRKEEELQREIEAIKKEYADKQAAKKKGKSKDGDGKAAEPDKDEQQKADEKEKDDKIKSVEAKAKGSSNDTNINDLPRIYSLHKNFHQMRIDRIRNAEMAKRNRERLSDPNALPSAPKGGI